MNMRPIVANELNKIMISRLAAKGLDLKLGANRIMMKFISERILVHRESLDIVAARMKRMNMVDRVCTKTIYRYIDMGLIQGVTNKTLWEKRNRSKKPTKHVLKNFYAHPYSSWERGTTYPYQ